MESILRQYRQKLKETSTKLVRNLYYEVAWDTRLVGIKGARGVGKTTMLVQRIKLAFPDPTKALYASLDDVWFGSHNLLDFAEEATQRGVTHLFLDEVHRLKGWERQIKNVYDSYPNLSIAFTGSSLLEIDHSVADLSRRLLLYSLPGLSFREFLEFKGINVPKLSLADVLYDHVRLAGEIVGNLNILEQFHAYLRHGYFPFFVTESEANYLTRVNNMIATVIDYDIPAVDDIEYTTLQKMKQLLSIMASQSPSPINVKLTSEMMDVSKNLLFKMFYLLDRSQILRLLYFKSERNPKSMVKPKKLLLDNTSLLYALGYADLGKVRESFFASMIVNSGHEIAYPTQGDLLVDGRYLFEIGGARKSFAQIKDLPDSFVVADDLPMGFGNKIPLWMFGALY